MQGGAVWDEDLIDEVASLVEFPVAVSSRFDESFLAVPKEALIYTMKDDQRYFPLVDQQGELLPRFIFITNIESRDHTAGHQRQRKGCAPSSSRCTVFL